jgi:hypothetical protein
MLKAEMSKMGIQQLPVRLARTASCGPHPFAEFTDLLVPAILTPWLLNSGYPDGIVMIR